MLKEVNWNDRIEFETDKQEEFLDDILKICKFSSLRGLSKSLKLNYSTTKKYHNEKRLMPFGLVKKLCKISGLSFDSLLISKIKSANWGAVKGGRKGIRSLIEKYPNQLSEWRKKGRKNVRLKKIQIPSLNEDLAEFIGAYLGDGTITPYFIRISGDSRYDLPYFNYLSKKVDILFNVKTSIVKEGGNNSCYLLISSKEICSFLKKEYHLKYGHKIRNQTAIPKQIMTNKELSLACLRGLVDTDGSISRRGKQFCVQFTSHNKKLINQVRALGRKYGIFTYSSGNETGTNKWEKVVVYFGLVGSSNLKHIIRFHLKYLHDKAIYVQEVPEYIEKSLYREMDLPFKVGP
jgi:hypothetical protein